MAKTELSNVDMENPLHRRFMQTLERYEQLLTEKNGRATKASRTRQMLSRKSIEQILSDWALSPATSGFDTLVSGGTPEDTGEAMILDFVDRFPPNVVYAARAKVKGRLEGTKPKLKPRRGRGSY